MSDKNEKVIRLNDVRLSYPVLFNAESFDDKPGSKKEFSASFLLPGKTPPVLEELRAALISVAHGKWGEKGDQILANLFRDDKLCLHDGDRKDYEGYAGNLYVRASNKVRPLVIGRDKSPLTEQDGKIYAGCYVNATISLWAQDNGWGKRINANLRGVQFYRDGEAFAGGSTGQVDEFEAHADEAGGTATALSNLGF